MWYLNLVLINRDEAGAALTKKAAYAEWDPEVLDLFLKYALYDVGGEGVRLKTDRFLVRSLLSNCSDFLFITYSCIGSCHIFRRVRHAGNVETVGDAARERHAPMDHGRTAESVSGSTRPLSLPLYR